MIAINTIISRTTKTIAAPIHRGDRTHSQLHVIIPSSLNAIKSIVSIPQNPIPPDEDELELEFLLFIEIFLPYV